MPSDSFADPVEIRRRIQRFAARIDRRDDYGQLLARGDVIRRRATVTRRSSRVSVVLRLATPTRPTTRWAGALLEDDCPDPDPPKRNALTFMYIGFDP